MQTCQLSRKSQSEFMVATVTESLSRQHVGRAHTFVRKRRGLSFAGASLGSYER